MGRRPVVPIMQEPLQWSPPLTGGNTVMVAMARSIRGIPPQWSPPLIGGSTGSSEREHHPGDAAAMEPAVQRREHQGR